MDGIQNRTSFAELQNHTKTSICGNNSSSNGAGETSFMTVLTQAGMGGRAAKNTSAVNASQLDEIISNFVSRHVKKVCHKLVGGDGMTDGDSNLIPPPSPSAQKVYFTVAINNWVVKI